ncbi:hypothetical protein ACP70R_023649 [Stipagrostis hirtigluma subsp. patula]
MDCFGFSDSKILCTDHSSFAFLYDTALRSVVPMPSLQSPKLCPISLSVPDQQNESGSVYVMEKVPRPRTENCQFEAFVYAMPEYSYDKAWFRHSLPLPPYVLDPGYENTRIHSYAVLGGGSHLCVSAIGIGTYCFNTASRQWSQAGEWILPFDGKAEYIPELDLWFGLSDRDNLPCASDLSSVLNGVKPELCHVWRNRYPPEWKSLGLTQLASLGSGRFCILDYFHTMLQDTYDYGGQPVVDDTFAVISGVELLASGKSNGSGSGANGSCSYSGNGNGSGSRFNGSCRDNGSGNGKQGIRMIHHKSKIHKSDGYTMIQTML